MRRSHWLTQTAQWTCWSPWMLSTSPFRGKSRGTEGGPKMSTTIAPLEERGVSCSLDNYLVLPDNTMDARIAAARRELGPRAVILGHHYQRDEVIRFADFRGDSYKLAQEAACISWPKARTCWRTRGSR